MADFVYPRGVFEVYENNIDIEGDTIVLLLTNSSHTPNIDNDYIADVDTNELSGTGYSRKTLASVANVLDDANNRVYVDCADVTYTSIDAGTAATATVAKSTGDDATSPLISSHDCAIDTNGGDLTLTINAGGLFRINC